MDAAAREPLSPPLGLALCAASLAALYALGRAFSRARLQRGGEEEAGRVAPVLFGATFALSTFLPLLVVLDLAHVLPQPLLLAAWRTSLPALLCLLLVVLPFAALSSAGPATRPLGSAVASLLLLAPLLRLLARPRAGAPPLPLLALLTGRAGALGVSLLALLAGFGAVQFPHDSLAVFITPVDALALAATERRCVAALRSAATKRKRTALAAHEAKLRAAAAGDGASVLRRLGAALRGGGRSPAEAAAREEAARCDADADALQELASELFTEAAAGRGWLARAEAATTLRGRAEDAAGWAMSGFAVQRVYKSARHLAFGEREAGVDAAAAGIRAAAGVASSSVTVGQSLQLLLVGILIGSSLRTFLAAVEGGARRWLRARGAAPSGAGSRAAAARLLHFCALVTGLYCLSVVLLLHERLPPSQRGVIAGALGAEPPSFAAENDAVFIAGAFATLSLLVAKHRMAKRAGAEDEAAKRS